MAIFWSSERRDRQVSSEPRTVGTILIEKSSRGALEARDMLEMTYLFSKMCFL